MKNKYIQEEIDNAIQLMGTSMVRSEKLEYTLYVEARRQINLTSKLNKMGTFHHVSAQLIPKLGADGKIRVPVEWISKTKGVSYENLDKQKIRKMELFGHYMSQDNQEAAQKVLNSVGVIDSKIQKENGR